MFNANYRFDDFDPPIPFLTGDASDLHSIISEVQRVENLSKDEIRERQRLHLKTLMSHFSKVSSNFRGRLRTNFPETSKDLTLPNLLALVEPQDKFYFQSIYKDIRESKVPKHHLPLHSARTSGSTGVPLKVRCTAINRAIGMAQLPWTHLKSGTDFSWRMASVKPSNTVLKECGEWDPATSLLFRVGPMLSVPTSLDVFTQLEELEKFRPDLLIIFPSVLKEYVSIWGSGKRNPLQLKVIRTLGETLSDEVRKMAGEATGANVLDTYSSSEVGRIATQVSPEGVYTVNNYSLIVEVLDEGGKRCKPDEIGRVVITDLFNFATPLVRYDIGDWAIPADDFHHTLSSIKGRSRNMISLPNGNKVWPLVGYREFSEVVPIRQFHIRQTSPEALQANFFVESTPSEKDEESLRKIICESLGYGFTITFAYQNAPLKKLPNQKLEDFVSLV